MKKIVILLFVIAVMTLAATYPTAGARAFAVTRLTEVGAKEVYYANRLSETEVKYAWAKSEMSGEYGFLYAEALRYEVQDLRQMHSAYAKRFNQDYKLFSRLGLI